MHFKSQIENLALKHWIFEMKNSQERFNTRLDSAAGKSVYLRT